MTYTVKITWIVVVSQFFTSDVYSISASPKFKTVCHRVYYLKTFYECQRSCSKQPIYRGTDAKRNSLSTNMFQISCHSYASLSHNHCFTFFTSIFIIFFLGTVTGGSAYLKLHYRSPCKVSRLLASEAIYFDIQFLQKAYGKSTDNKSSAVARKRRYASVKLYAALLWYSSVHNL